MIEMTHHVLLFPYVLTVDHGEKGERRSLFSKLLAIFWKVSIKTNVIYQQSTNVKTLIFDHDRFQDVVIDKNYSCRPSG